MEQENDVVTVVRDDGKAFTIQRNVLAEHINRGFRVKNEKDQPSEQELQGAVGYMERQRRGEANPEQNAPQKPSVGEGTAPEENAGNSTEPENVSLEDMSADQLREKAADMGLAISGTKPELVARITEALQAEVDDMVDHVVTENDLVANPELVEKGVQVGDTVKLPAENDNPA